MNDPDLIREALVFGGIDRHRDALAALKRMRALLLDIEGTVISYWTDIPEAELERIRLRIREVVDGA